MLIILFLLLSFSLLTSQERVKPIEHEVKVELVLIEVFVTDKKGNFVDDLTSDDFEVFEDGRKIPIQYFNVVKPEKEIKEKKEETALAQKLFIKESRFVLIFDRINTNPIFLFRAIPEIEKILKSISLPAQKIAIIELNTSDGMKVIKPFSSEKFEILEYKGNIWKDIEKECSENIREELLREETLGIMNGFISNPAILRNAVELEKKHTRVRRLEKSLGAFLGSINYLRKFEGMKTILLISDGFPIEKGELFKPPEFFSFFGKKRIKDSFEFMEEFIKFINEEGMILYTLSPKGIKLRLPQLMSGPLHPTEFGKVWPGMVWTDELEQWTTELFTIEKIAEETGGVYLREARKYEDFVKHFERDLTHFYEIGYKPPREINDGKYHKIEVRVKRPDVIVRYKKGYMDFNEKELEKRNLTSAFLSPSFFKDIEFSCNMDIFPSFNGDFQFWTRLKVPLNQFEKIDSPPQELTLTFGVKEEEKFHMGETKLRLKEALQRKSPFIYFIFGTSPLKLKQGEYQAFVILRRGGEKMGGWEKILKIPEMKSEPFVINSILGYIRTDIRSDGNKFSISMRDGALNLSRYKFYPLIENEILENSKVVLFLQIYNPKGVKEFSLNFPLYKDEELISNLPYEKVESYFDRETKIINGIYLLDFRGILSDQYKLAIRSVHLPFEKLIEVKVLSK